MSNSNHRALNLAFLITTGVLMMAAMFNTGCRKYIVIGSPKTQITGEFIFTTDATATSAMLGIYSRMMTNSGFASGSLGSVSFLAGLSADELTNYSTSADPAAFYNNELLPVNGYIGVALWGEMYQYIFTANAIIEGVESSKTITERAGRQLTGEAKFLRAFCHFYLVNLFGDVPVVTTTDYEKNAKCIRQPEEEVYRQIVSDLTEATQLLNEQYVDASNNPTAERARPNRFAAAALLSRVYLYLGRWADAENMASMVISHSEMYSLPSELNSVFIKNSPEAIWQLMPASFGLNTNEGRLFILAPETIPGTCTLAEQLCQSFEDNDQRRVSWIDSITTSGIVYRFPYKYKIRLGSELQEYSMVLRLAEQYLIRAEARAHQDHIEGAQTDINSIRSRAGLDNTVATDQAGLLLALETERKHELFTEWGHRWLDLKRTSRAGEILGVIKASTWQESDALYPIPQRELNTNPFLKQNSGY